MFQNMTYISIMILTYTSLISLRLSRGQKLAVSPCVDMKAISWVRDSRHCDQYYICHFGSPLSMPACPKSQVWSNIALNCVPINSRWDDCPTELLPKNGDPKIQSRTRTTPRLKVIEDSKFDDFNTVTLFDNESKQKRKRIRNTLRWHRYGNTKLPTKMPLFTPKSPTRFWVTGQETFHEDKVQDPRNQNIVPTTPSVTRTTTARDWALRKKGSHRHTLREETTQRQWSSNKEYLFNYRKQNEIENFCLDNPGALWPHPTNCHWYYNCSLGNGNDQSTSKEDIGDTWLDDDDRSAFMRLRPFRVRSAGAFVWECRYPQLFDDVTFVCREFINVRCGSRWEPVDQCEYSQRRCGSGRCESCDHRFGRCRGKENGIYPIQSTQWNSVFMTCYQNRNIAQDKCNPPKPIFSPERFDCVSLFEVPKVSGGLLPDCRSRPDGYYPDEQGRCAIFFRCSLGNFRGYDECPPATVFDPSIPACQPYSAASLPCGAGQAPLCGGKSNGMYADPYGRCTHFFQCINGAFQRYYSCDEGIFDPLTQSCTLSAAQTLRPCGLLPSPCETLPTGAYPDQGTKCRNFIECHRGIIITNGTCDRGLVFSAISGRCDVPQKAPPPCGVASACRGRVDGKYPALDRGCSFYYECHRGEFTSLRRCTAVDGGFFFNPATGRCDYPQNICPPCGHRWWGCARHYTI